MRSGVMVLLVSAALMAAGGAMLAGLVAVSPSRLAAKLGEDSDRGP